MKTGFLFLAAGNSSRFFSTAKIHKALYPIGDKTWLEKQVECAGSHDFKVLVGKDAPLFYKKVPSLKEHFIVNPDAMRGPFSSLQLGLESLTVDQYVIQPIDCAAISENALSKLLSMPAQYEAVIPKFIDKAGHPVVLRKNFGEKLLRMDVAHYESRLDTQIRYLPENKKIFVDIPEKAVLSNFNREADLINFTR